MGKRTYLSKREMHERQIVHRILAHTDNHNPPASPHRKRSCDNTALHTRTLNHAGWSGIFVFHPTTLPLTSSRPKQFTNRSGVASRIQVALHLVRRARGDKFLGEIKPLLLNVGDDDGVCTRGSRCEQSAEADGTRTANDDAAAQSEVCDA